MKRQRKALCPRLFEVEALRDGRLQGAERTRFERHLQVCETCAAEAQALQQLGHRLQDDATRPNDELHARRERTRLLAAFDDSLVQSGSGGWQRGARAWLTAGLQRVKLGFVNLRLVNAGFAAVAFVAIALVGVALILWQPWSPAARTAVTEIAATPAIVSSATGTSSAGTWVAGGPVTSPSVVALSSVVELQPEPGTRWERRVEAGRELVQIRDGALRLRVQRATDRLPLLVVLPDGELEDIGTTFTVIVTRERTERVVVEEGSVLLRLRGHEPLAISPSRVWVAPVREIAPSPQAPEVAVSSNRGARGPSDAVRDSNQAAVDFRAAIAALNAASPRQAAELFARFVARYPKDARAEDASYMRVVALRRAGDFKAARAAARNYLERYPRGFRFEEMSVQAAD